jgi:hypothetical protein
MSLRTLPLEARPIIRVGKNGSELVWPNGARRRFCSPEIDEAHKELNRVTRLPRLGPTAAQQQQNRSVRLNAKTSNLGSRLKSHSGLRYGHSDHVSQPGPICRE